MKNRSNVSELARKILNCSLVVATIIGLTACGSLKRRDVNQSEIRSVRKVAIAAFSFEQPQAGLAKLAGEKNYVPSESNDALLALHDAAKTLQSKLRWQILNVDTMRANEAYKKAYASKMEGFQMGKMPPQGKEFIAPGVMDAQSIRRMKPAERDELMKALGVDAIMEAKANIGFASKGVKVMGVGSRYPQAILHFFVFKKGVEQAVWFEGQIEGVASETSVGKTGFFDEELVTRLGRTSLKTAFEKVGPERLEPNFKM